MAAYIAIILSSISIVLLIAVLLKFKKLFSTESLIENTKIKMNKIISDINKNANMDIDLINEATRRTRQLIKETDEKMEEFKEASQMLRDMIATVEHQTKPPAGSAHCGGRVCPSILSGRLLLHDRRAYGPGHGPWQWPRKGPH